MPRPIPLSVRHSIVTLRARHYSMPEISAKLSVSLSTVKTILSRHAARGDAGLKTDYDRCGQSGERTDALTVRYFICLRKWHPSWGYDKINSMILARHPAWKTPDRRTVYRWWRSRGLVVLKSKLAKEEKQWANDVHDGWQIDAKEMMRLADETTCCWLNIVDEKSGMVIDPPVFPPR